MDTAPSQSEVVAFMTAYPKAVIRILSVYYPLTAEWLQKYGDILFWGSYSNADISPYASMDHYEEGIIFNHSISWTDDIRSIVAANLLFRGGDLAITSYGNSWKDYKQSDLPEQGLYLKASNIISFAASCPLTIDTFAQVEAAAFTDHERICFDEVLIPEGLPENEKWAYMEKIKPQVDAHWAEEYKKYYAQALVKYRPTLQSELSWDEVVHLFTKDNIPILCANPDLWRLSLSKIFTESVSKNLLDTFYIQHLNGDLHLY